MDLKLCYFVLTILITKIIVSQVSTIYSEDFSNDYKKGATSYLSVSASQPTDGNWSYTVVGTPDCDGGSAASWDDVAWFDGASVIPSTALAFRWNDVNNGSTTNRVDWYSKVVTGSYNTITISVPYAISNGSSANSIYCYYIVDGGTPTLFGSSVNQSTASGTLSISSLTCSTSIQIYVKAITRDANTTYVYIDDVSITAISTSPLPIELTYFKVTEMFNSNLIEWETATEINNDYFSLYRSSNGKDWVEITKINGNDSSPYKHYYQYVDKSFNEGINYYYLRQVDNDGYYKDYDMLDVFNHNINEKIIRITNILGQDINNESKGIRFIHYSNGSILKSLD
jgi:hypothetical protein